MKKILLLIFLANTGLCIQAQEKMIIKETFENNRLKWDEVYDKDFSIGVMDGYFELKNEKDGRSIYTVTELPVNPHDPFKVTTKFIVPKINDKYYFGIVFNHEDENNYSYFVVYEKRFRILKRIEGVERKVREGNIILNSGKNKEVVIEMESKGGKLSFKVDNMEVIDITTRDADCTFGFLVQNANTLKIEEVIIEQMQDE